MNEATFMGRLVHEAKATGWRAYHTHDSRRSEAGFPDLVLVRPPRLLLVECKSETGRVTAEQNAWLTDLRAVPGVETYLWRPSDWAEIFRTLARDEASAPARALELIASKPSIDADVEAAFVAWNTVAKLHQLPQARRLTVQRRSALQRCLREAGGLTGWEAALRCVTRSPFLLGDNARGWRAGMDWLMKPEVFQRLLEGAYERAPIDQKAARRDRILDNARRIEESLR